MLPAVPGYERPAPSLTAAVWLPGRACLSPQQRFMQAMTACWLPVLTVAGTERVSII
ncbi:hypothetical protein VQ335_004741 [Salmonella enterica]|nr:hypothetical protein [Salmonella enterica]